MEAIYRVYTELPETDTLAYKNGDFYKYWSLFHVISLPEEY
jgi:hypothetical protein